MVKKTVFIGYLSMILDFIFIIFWYVSLVLSIEIEDVGMIIGIWLAIIDFFVWLGLGIYLFKNKETKNHGKILLIIWLILFVLIVIGLIVMGMRRY
jgi:hypothetical protein